MDEKNCSISETEAKTMQDYAHPEVAVIVARDFNHVELRLVLPKCYKNVNFPTRDNNIPSVFTKYKQTSQEHTKQPHLHTLIKRTVPPW